MTENVTARDLTVGDRLPAGVGGIATVVRTHHDGNLTGLFLEFSDGSHQWRYYHHTDPMERVVSH